MTTEKLIKSIKQKRRAAINSRISYEKEQDIIREKFQAGIPFAYEMVLRDLNAWEGDDE